MQLDLNDLTSAGLKNLCGVQNSNLHRIEQLCQVNISNRGAKFVIQGSQENQNLACQLIQKLTQIAEEEQINQDLPMLFLQDIKSSLKNEKANGAYADKDSQNISSTFKEKNFGINLSLPRVKVKPHGARQTAYLESIFKNDVTFGVGPAGTGKTFLAVAMAVDSLLKANVEKLILVRPAVEAGEKLGFLPGDLTQKVDPYLRPLYDALFFMLGTERVAQMLERQIIEIAPLAYMRGRTLNDAFVILDESQNTTKEQMKMFLTRLGYGSKAVITGDLTQIDLPRGVFSGLAHAPKVLQNIKEIGIHYFLSDDVVRHPLVQKIIDAYQIEEDAASQEQELRNQNKNSINSSLNNSINKEYAREKNAKS